MVLAGILAASLNAAVCVLLLRIEQRLEEEGKIPTRGKILYLWNFNFFTWGDMVFVSLLDYAIIVVLAERWPPPPLWALGVCLVAVAAWAAIWNWVWLSESHNPDSLYPRTGAISPLGKLHLAYFTTQYWLGLVGLWMVFLMLRGERAWSPVAFVGLAAAAAYFTTWFSDLFAGRFKRRR